jgi:hypothetical protein
LMVGTVLTLYVVPMVYALLAREKVASELDEATPSASALPAH